MAYLRTAYSVDVTFSDGGPVFRMHWYRAHKKARIFPGVHMGLSRYWFNYRETIGEQGNVHYEKGKNVGNRKGQCFKGLPVWFEKGFTAADLVAAPPQRDECTSCPARSARPSWRPSSVYSQTMWGMDRDGLLLFFPLFLFVDITGAGPGVDGTYMSDFNPGTFSQWTFDFPTGTPGDFQLLTQQRPNPLIWQFYSQGGGAFAGVWSGVIETDPFDTHFAGDGVVFPSTADFHVYAAKVETFYGFDSLARFAWKIPNPTRTAYLSWRPSTRHATHPGGFSPGFSAGFERP